MKGLAALIFVTFTIFVNCQEDVDLSDPDQFSYYLREHYEASFNGPEPTRREHVEKYYPLLDAKLKFWPCGVINNNLKWYRSRVEAMFRTFTSCAVNSIKFDDKATQNDGLEMVFVLDATYKSYTGRFSTYPQKYYIRKPDEKSPYKVWQIEEDIDCYN